MAWKWNQNEPEIVSLSRGVTSFTGRNRRFTLFNDYECPFRMIYETKILNVKRIFFQEISKIINKAGKVSNIFRTIKYLEIRQLQNLSFLTKKFLSKIFIKNKICFVLKVLECTNIFDIGIAAYIDPRVLLERYSGSSRIL